MPLDKDTLHVVVRLPFKRPENFVEPPPILWTDEMEMRLWQYMSQKNTDWNFIAEQLGVPTPYLVRHAAFLYETQLRGIQQQLRLSEVSKAPSSAANTPPPSQRRTISTSRSSSNRQTPTTSFRNSTPPPAAPLETAGPEDSASSMMLSAISNIAPRESPATNTPIRANSPFSGSSSHSSQLHPSGSSASSSLHKSSFLRPQSSVTPRQSQRAMDQSSSHSPSPASRPPSRQQDPTPSSVTSQMASLHLLQQDEEPAFLPSKSRQSSRLLPSLHRSHSGSLDKGKGKQAPAAEVSMGSAYESQSPWQPTQQSTEEFAQQQKQDRLETIRSRILEASSDIRQSSTTATDTAASAASRTPPVSQEPTGSSQPAFLSRTMPARQADMARPSQSTTHLADSLDSSITQSALEDAFLSNFNSGSKMSSLAFSRKYPPPQ